MLMLEISKIQSIRMIVDVAWLGVHRRIVWENVSQVILDVNGKFDGFLATQGMDGWL